MIALDGTPWTSVYSAQGVRTHYMGNIHVVLGRNQHIHVVLTPSAFSWGALLKWVPETQVGCRFCISQNRIQVSAELKIYVLIIFNSSF